MGIIFRQSLKSSIYSYLGVIIGFITVGYLMPEYLSKEEIGLRMQIQSYALLIGSFLAFGIPQSIVRMFPHFMNSKNKNYGILSLVGIVTLISTVLFYMVFKAFGHILFKDDIIHSSLFAQHYHLILPFTFATLFFVTLDGYATAVKESTIGIFLKDLVLRIIILLTLLTFIIFDSVNYTEFINFFTVAQYIPVFLLIFFLSRKSLFPITKKISFPSVKVKSELISVSLFSWVNVLSGVAIISIDTVMLSKLNGSADVGVYTTVSFFAGLMLIPIKGLGKISNSIIANHFKNGLVSEIESIYKKSAINPFILGLFFLGNLLLLIPFIFNVILKDYSEGIWVLIFLAVSNLIKMATGIKFIIISNSKHYKWNTIFLSVFIASLIITNLIFIPAYGIKGAAFASLLSNTIHQIFGLIFIKKKFNLSPFEFRYAKISAVFILLGAVLYWIPDFNNPQWTAIIKSGVFSLAFLGYILKFKVSTELSDQFNNVLKFIGK